MTVHTHQIRCSTQGDNDTIDLTDQVAGAVDESGIRHGIAVVFVPGSTAGITTVEYEKGMVEDLKRHLDSSIPRNRPYRHNHGGESNGHAHVRAAVIGPSVAVPVVDGQLALGTWQQIVLVDCDDRPRSRTVTVQTVGD